MKMKKIALAYTSLIFIQMGYEMYQAFGKVIITLFLLGGF